MGLPCILVALAMLAQCGMALQVTPNSPCSSFCVDSNDLDFSDPNSSNTGNKDITCYDKEFASSSAGQKFHRCMSCLQDSTFSQGQQSDQAWFLYNLRYTFDYCIFGFPNATNVASTPCSTSTACGGLEAALTSDGLDATDLQSYGYCDADGAAMGGPSVSKCIACVAASDGQDYMANFMVALGAGCQQRPPTGTLVGLNDTVFSTAMISAVDPSASAATSSNEGRLPTTTVVGVAIGAIVVALVIAGIVYICYRKRRNRRLRLNGSPGQNIPKRSIHRPASSLSFRCQTHLSPRSPAFFPGLSESTIREEKPYTGPQGGLGSNPVFADSPTSHHSPWSSRPGFMSDRGSRGVHGPSLPLHSISTATPTVPNSVYYSTSPKAKGFSPIDDMTTPASTTSTKSTSNLLPLKPYNPAEYGISAPQMGTVPEAVYTSPTSASTASPLISRAWDQKQPVWDKPLPPRVSSRPSISVAGALGGGKGKKVNNTGSPVETKEISIKFPGPPSPKRFS
ncbi:hypothetical protein JX265_011811 [Neoarthrinium moseri]|uniref:LPXTG-domain-containing protein n=1 Tax=Neoarthrinium moseri TaxID=1658444 RepID=A0A9P9WBA2_9PEZI|nr:hypothetical protein JX265_011811 [Neoarthrinium moseri]